MTASQHDILRIGAIVVNVLFGVFLWLSVMVWGGGAGYADGLLVVFPPALAVVALAVRPKA